MTTKGPLGPIESDIKVGAVYQHAKGGGYRVIALARCSETLETQVVYVNIINADLVWVRPASMWFEEVDSSSGRRPRFVEVEVSYTGIH